MDQVCPNPKCGHVYKGHDNRWGKVCLKCGAYIPTREPNGFDKTHLKAKMKALRYIRGFLTKRVLGDNNANK